MEPERMKSVCGDSGVRCCNNASLLTREHTLKWGL